MGQKFRHIQTQFDKGPLSTRAVGRRDNAFYDAAVKSSENMVMLPQGPAWSRPGFVYVNEVKDSTKNTRLIEFQFNAEQTYLIELGDGYARFYKDRAQILDGGSPYEVTTPWTEADLNDIRYFQSADVVFFLHEDYQPRSLGRISDTNWTLQTVEFVDGPWLPINATDTTITPSASTGSITLTASDGIFDANDVGRYMRLKVSSGDWGYVEITGFTSATEVDADVVKDLSGTADTVFWRFSVYGGSYYGWPSCGTIHEERFTVGGSQILLDNVAFSQTGLYGPDQINFSPSESDGQVIDSNGFSVSLAGEEVNRVLWLSTGRALTVGTSSSEYSVTGRGTTSRAPLTPEDRLVQRETRFGSQDAVRPQQLGNSVLYIERSGEKLRELLYDLQIDAYISRDISIINYDLFQGGVIRTAFQRSPDPIMWMVKNDGALIGFTYERINEVEGGHFHRPNRDGEKVLDVAVIARPDGVHDDVYILVERSINGSTVKYIEYMAPYIEELQDVEQAVYLDCAIEVTNNPESTTITGLDHLEGEEVDVLADGSPHPKRTVSSGEIELEYEVADAKVGFAYTKELRLLPPEVRQLGTIMGRTTRVNEIDVYLTNTVGIQAGTENAGQTDDVPFSGFDIPLGDAVPLFTGIQRIAVPSGYAGEGDSLILQNNLPTPFNVNSVVQLLEIND